MKMRTKRHTLLLARHVVPGCVVIVLTAVAVHGVSFRHPNKSQFDDVRMLHNLRDDNKFFPFIRQRPATAVQRPLISYKNLFAATSLADNTTGACRQNLIDIDAKDGAAFAAVPPPPISYRRVCYFPQYAIYRPGVSKIAPDQVDPHLCTHIIYAFAKPDSNYKIVSYDTWADVDLTGFKKINGLKQQNPDLKVLIALGGYSAGSLIFSNLAQTNATRATFITSLLTFLDMWKFDGLDVDWEFPAWYDGRPQDKQNFPIWLAEIRAAFNTVAASAGGKQYLLTFAATASSLTIDTSYNLPAIVPSVDFINLMSYDLHLANEPQVDHHSPLYSYTGEVQSTFTTHWAVQKYLQSGVPANKLVVGMPLYGRAWTLANANQITILSPGAGPATAGPYLQTAGFLGYLEICQKIRNNGWVKSSGLNRTYATGQGQWVGYDDVEDAVKKANYVVQNGLGGIMFWELSYEDFGNVCGGGNYPLVNAVKTVLTQAGSSTSTTTTTSTAATSIMTTRTSTTSAKPPTSSSTTTTTVKPTVSTTTSTTSTTTATAGLRNIVCLREGFWSDPRYADCSRFVRCVAAGATGQPLVIYMYLCPAGLVFDMSLSLCNYAPAVVCTFDSTAVRII